MQTDSEFQDLKVLTTQQTYSMDLLNGGHLGNQPAFPGHSFGGNKLTLEQVDPSTFDEDSDDDEFSKGVKPGKKTKGRVKIKMEFIENKLRRYTTFSKRKTGIMKKAYELSTLTGTQVMLLVASETGHVYTFATRKLQPMITSESGKALIQTCLNSPDPPPVAPGQQQAVEQRMNPTGFEETELTYAVDDENGKLISVDASNGSLKPVYSLSSTNHTSVDTSGMVAAQQQAVTPSHNPQGQTYQIATPTSSAVSMTTLVQQPMSGAVNSSPSSTKTSNQGSISLQLPGLPPGIILQPGTSFTIPVQTSNGSQASSSPQQPTVYRIPAPSQQIITSSGMVQSDSGQRSSIANTSAQQQAMNVITAATPQASPALTPSVFMYQTPQGIVYAPATGPMQDKTIFNLQQPQQALSVQQESTGGQQQGSQQQIITIPVPVSLSGTQQVLQIPSADTGQMQELSQPSAAKKARK